MAHVEQCYQMGATQIHVGLSATVMVVTQPYQNGGFFKIHAGAGTLAIVQGASSIYSAGYAVGATEVIPFVGPARFFLAAATATMTVALVASYSAGMSFQP
jgi:hypothetical protein